MIYVVIALLIGQIMGNLTVFAIFGVVHEMRQIGRDALELQKKQADLQVAQAKLFGEG